MKEALEQLATLINSHSDVNHESDISIILNEADMHALLADIVMSNYFDAYMKLDTDEYYIISSNVAGVEKLFFIEGVRTEDGLLKYDETDILIIPNYLPQELENHFVSYEHGYRTLIRIDETVTFAELVAKIKNEN